MTKKLLLFSSLGSLVVHMVLFSKTPRFPRPWMYCLCLGTSIWNHGMTSDIAKWADRVMVGVCVVHNLFWLSAHRHQKEALMGMVMTLNGVSFYFVSKRRMKKKRQIMFHFMSHVCATCSDVFLGVVVHRAFSRNQFLS